MADRTKKNDKQLYLVDRKVLPDVFHKVMAVKQGMEERLYSSVNQAVRSVGISRSAYYKYRNSIFEYNNGEYEQILEVIISYEYGSRILKDIMLSLNKELDLISVDQAPPINGFVNLRLTLSVQANTDYNSVLNQWRKLHGVRTLQHTFLS